jgi:putative oxidoreductase
MVQMAYAYLTVHSTHELLPLLNGGELAIIHCFLFLFVAISDSGIFSIDHILEKRSAE